MGWMPDEMFYAMKAAKGGGKGGGKGNWTQNQWQAAPAQRPSHQNALLAQMLTLLQPNPTWQGNAGSSTGQAASGPPWKTRFYEALKKSGVAENPAYVTMANTGGEGWLGSLTMSGQVIASGEAAMNKKEAEQNAAKAALQALYPDQFNLLSAGDGPKKTTSTAKMGMLSGGRSGQGQKRTEPSPNSATEQCAKSKLMLGVQVMIRNTSDRDLTKQDLVYKTTENQGPPMTYMSTVTITDYGQSFCGEWSASNAAAENSAAQAAWNVMGDMLSALQEQQTAKKKAKKDAEHAAHAAKKLLQAAQSAGMA